MNSYPPELLVQLAPVMFVAGLEVPAVPDTIPSAAPGSPPRPPQDPFVSLTARLRDALLSQRTAVVWQPEKSKTFQAVLVDKDIRFPPRKIPLSPDPHGPMHSPLSPLTPTSPLHPDGLVAPIWVRKHTSFVPSVFILFIRLYESPPHHMPASPLDPPHPDRDAEERRKDAEMSAEIALRKKSTSERGVKLTVVLMASRKMLDDPALDARLTFIRRQSGLDYRAALFVLSPVSPSELSEFIKSLQQALYEPAVEYYTSHSKRVRRKRNRHAQAASSYIPPLPPLGTTAPARPLRPEGWTVRYEYKMACFAEFRGEYEVALKMPIRVCLRCLARLPFSLHAPSVGRKLKYWQIASISRFASSICTTTSTHLLSPNTPSTQGDLATSRVAGESAKTRLSFGAGSRDNIVHLPSWLNRAQTRP